MFSAKSANIAYPITVDPCNMSETETALLGYFLDSYRESSRGERIIPDGVSYPFPPLAGIQDTQSRLYQLWELFFDLKITISTITLTYPLIMRGSPGNPETVRYDIYSGDILGTGAYGCVANVVGVLKVQKNNSIQFKTKSRVSKIQNIAEADSKNEFDLTSRIKKFGIKYPVFLSELTHPIPSDCKLQPMLKKLSGKNCSIMVMRRLDGQDLKKMIDADSNGLARLSTNMRLALSIAVLRGLEEIHRVGIVHRDVKLVNAIGDVTRDPANVTHIDFGLSKDARKTPSVDKRVGTPLYLAPEVLLRHPQNKIADIYTVSWTLQMLWCGDDNQAKGYSQVTTVANNRDFSSLFKGIHDLDKTHQKEIRNMFIQMTQVVPNQRCTLADAICVLENIVLDRKCKNLNKNESESARYSYWLGRQLSEQCIQAINSPSTLKDEFDLRLDILGNDPLSVSFFIDGLNEMIFRMEQSKAAVFDEAGSIAEIVDLLDNPAKVFFRPLKTKNAIRTVFDNLLAAFTSNQTELKSFSTHLSILKDDVMCSKLNKLIRLPIRTLDDMALFNEKCAKHFPALHAAIAADNIRLFP